jgi:hypothetical protein
MPAPNTVRRLALSSCGTHGRHRGTKLWGAKKVSPRGGIYRCLDRAKFFVS